MIFQKLELDISNNQDQPIKKVKQLTNNNIAILFMTCFIIYNLEKNAITYRYDIKTSDTYDDLVNILSKEGAILLKEVLPSIIDGTNERIKQDENEVTFAYVIKREDEHIDFNKSVKEVDRKVRGLYSIPLANTIINDIEYKIVKGHYEICESIVNKINVINKKQLGIGCIDGIYYIDEIKPSGKKIMKIQDFLNGVDINKFKDYIIK